MQTKKGNVIKLEHNQFVSTNRNAAVELRITMEAFGTEHKQKILNALKEAGYEPKKVGAKLYINNIEEKLKCPNDLCGSGHFLYEKDGKIRREAV